MSFKQQSYAFHIRGLLDYPIKIAGLPTPLPPQARLKAYVSHVERQPLEYHPVANISGKEGFVYAWFFIVKSGNFNYMEACPRLTVDGGEPILMAPRTSLMVRGTSMLDSTYSAKDFS
eukprot:COSAG04_NODE_3485_length_2779_cov_1.137687_3_plen_118_part_00